MAKHTPGPWTNSDTHSGPTVWRVESDAAGYPNDGWVICDLYGPQAEANARLIAAAPDLLAALEKIAGQAVFTDQGEWIREVARAAITKATGGPS